MKFDELKEKTKKAVSKAGKRTVIATMAVFVIGIAVLLNLILIKDDGGITNLNDELSDVAGLLTDGSTEEASDEDYFANIVLNRQSARDEAMEVLLSVTDSSTAIEEVKNSAYSDIEQIALDIENEANIETMILAKGFEQCIAVVNGNSANVIVKTDGLTPGEVAQISEIVYEECGILPNDLKIIEKN